VTEAAALRFDAVSIRFPGPHGPMPVVHDVSFEVPRGKCLVIVGESGSGKSMCCQAVLGIVPAPGKVSGGGIHWQGADLLHATPAEWMRVRGSEIAMIFQDPTAALNPLMTVGQQIMDVVLAHRAVTRGEARDRAIEVLRQVRFPDPVRRMRSYPWELSGGLRQRVAIAMALSCGPQLIIADEATTNLDVSIQAQIIDLLRELRDALGLSIIFVTHDLGLAPEIGDDVLVMYAGHAAERGPVRQVLANPCHPYTIGLLRSAPTLRSRRTEPLRPIPGLAARPDQIGGGAPFRSRCPVVVEGICDAQKPGWTECGDGHAVACHRYARDGRAGVL
jgi:oligopeptide/dipeptide ABC transporter ATP-binding protein